MLARSAPFELPSDLAVAARALSRGEPILIYDAADRESETDLVFLSERATPELVRLARRDAGGLVCAAVSEEFRRRVGLPFYTEMIAAAAPGFPALRGLVEKPRYDRRSAFGITVNHRSNFTGVPDNDRAVTIRTLGELAGSSVALTDTELLARFQREFVSPGHVPLLYAAPALLGERKGHTELAVSLCRMAGLSESATVCEMLGDSGGARDPHAARAFARARGYAFLEGARLVEVWRGWASA